MKETNDVPATVFPYRTDFYWQFVALYAVALIGYAALKGTFSGNTFTLVFYDPIVLFLSVIVLISALAFFVNQSMHRSIEVTKEGITFQNRWRRRFFPARDILGVSVGRERGGKVRNAARVVKIRLASRRRIVRIRPALYEDSSELFSALLQFKRK